MKSVLLSPGTNLSRRFHGAVSAVISGLVLALLAALIGAVPARAEVHSSNDAAFVSTWDTRLTVEGDFPSTNDHQVQLPLSANGTYDFTVQWGDGNSDTITSHADPAKLHTYDDPGSYTVTIAGQYEGFSFDPGPADSPDANKITDISSFGPLKLGDGRAYFYDCKNLNFTATDAPDLSGTTDLSFAFYAAEIFNSPIGHWNVSGVQNMNNMFQYSVFDQDLSDWEVTSLESAEEMAISGTLSTANYNALLTSWAAQNVQMGVPLGVGSTQYSPGAATTGRTSLVTKGWSIQDGDQTSQPGPPTNVTATGGDQQASVSWTAAATPTGNPTILGYTVTASPGGLTCAPAEVSTTSCTVIGLTNGQPYTFTAIATNSAGAGVVSAASNSVTPAPPQAPQTITFMLPAKVSVQTKTHALTGTASSGLPVTYASNSPAVCTISGSTLNLLSAGICSVAASQAGSGSFDPAADVTAVATVSSLPEALLAACPTGSCAGANLVGLDLAGLNLSGLNFSRANLTRANLSDADLSGANFAGATLIRANLAGVRSQLPIDDRGDQHAYRPPAKYSVNLRAADLRAANLRGAYLPKAQLSRAQLVGADLRRVSLQRANLGAANAKRADFRKADLRLANLHKTTLTKAKFAGAKLKGAYR